jgi:hypothetical protein
MDEWSQLLAAARSARRSLQAKRRRRRSPPPPGRAPKVASPPPVAQIAAPADVEAPKLRHAWKGLRPVSEQPPTVLTDEELRARCLEVQAEWDEQTELSRRSSTHARVPYQVPGTATAASLRFDENVGRSFAHK